MEELRKCWKVPYIVYFCNLFEQKLDLIDLRVDEFEEAIIDDCGTERNIVVIHLIQKLLKPFLNRSVDLTNYEQFLLTVLKRYSLEHLYLQDKEHNQWSELSMLTKLDIIYSLCEVRLQLSDTEQKLTEFEANELRIEPLGVDSRGNKLWYFGDLRLYEEKQRPKDKNRNITIDTSKTIISKKTKKNAKNTSKQKQKQRKLNKKETKKKKRKTDSTDDDEEDDEEEDEDEEEESEHDDLEMDQELEFDQESELVDVVEVVEQEEVIEPVEVEEKQNQRRSGRKSLVQEKKIQLPPPLSTPVTQSTRTTRRTMLLIPKEEAELLLKPNVCLPTRVSARRSRKLTAPEQEPETKTEEPIKEEIKTEEKKTEQIEPTIEPIKEEEETVEPSNEKENIKIEEKQPEVQKQIEEPIEPKPIEIKEQIITEEEESIPFVPIKHEIKQPVRLIEEKAEYKQELKYWSCICINLEDWQTVHDKYSSSKKKNDQELAKLISTSYLPEMPSLFQKAEKERMHRLMAMAPKRQSQRLQTKQTEYNLDSSDDLNDQTSQQYSSENSNTSHNLLPLTEQEKIKREEIAKQREERLKQRLLKRDYVNNDYLNTSLSINDEMSQDAANSGSSSHKENKDEFNIRNFFLMHKVLSKLLQCKYAWPFKNAVSEEDAPDYNKIIENPMDLSTVQYKINSKAYKSRQEFCDDLEMVVSNCLQYNGEDTYYGKLALKFQNFFKRWLQIFYPREISTSLEEKNRQLMNLMSRNAPNGVLFHDLTNDENNLSQLQITTHIMNNEMSCGTENAQDGTEFKNNLFASPFDNSKLKKRKPVNPDKDKYIQEPQYVTKRTSSGRLVKMKISTDYDYTSDQELEAKKKKKEEEDECEGIQQKHRVGIDNMSTSSMSSRSRSNSSISTNDRSDDEDFMGRKLAQRKATPAARRGRGGASAARGRPPRRTVKALTESGLLNSNGSIKFRAFNEYEEDTDTDLPTSVLRHRTMHNYDDNHLNDQQTSDDTEEEDDDSDNDLRTLNLKKLNSSTNLFRRLTNISDNDSPPSLTVPKIGDQTKQLTFEQYVKKLTGSCTISNEPANDEESQKVNNNTPTRLSIKIAPAPSLATILNQHQTTATTTAKIPLTIPIINPAIKAALTKYNQQTKSPTVLSNQDTNSTVVKVITVPSSNPVNTQTIQQSNPINGSKYIIVNSNNNLAEQTTQQNNSIKVISLSQFGNGINLKQISSGLNIKTNCVSSNSKILSPILNKQIVMINNNSINKQIIVNNTINTTPVTVSPIVNPTSTNREAAAATTTTTN